MDAILEMDRVTKSYGDFQLRDICMHVPKGMIVGLIGENGAGKTTIMKALLHLITIDSGEIRLFKKNMPDDEKQCREMIGTVFADSMFPENMSMEKIDKVMKQIYKNWDSSLFFQFQDTFSLPLKKRIKEYSKGMKMKLSIACALSHHPKLLLLDEATSGLDPVVRDEILDIFLDFVQDEEHAILFSSHITSDIEKVADYVILLHQGKILLSQEKDELLYNSGILRATPEQFAQLHEEDIIGYRKSSYAINVLVKDRKAISQRFASAVIDPAALEDIMLYMMKGGC